MKKIILILALLISTCSYSQVFRMKAFEFKAYYYPFTDFPENWIPMSSIVILDVTKETFNVYDKNYPQNLVIGNSKKKQYDADGEKVIFSAFDENGIKCEISFKTFNDKSGRHAATVIVEYKNVMYFYRLENY